MTAAIDAQLPRRGERVAAVGCGTSLHMARAYAVLRESSGHGETDAFPASEFPAGRRYDRVVAITRSGTTTEILRLLAQLDPGSRVVLTADAGSPARSLADAFVVFAFADERSVDQRSSSRTPLFSRSSTSGSGMNFAPFQRTLDEAAGGQTLFGGITKPVLS